MGCCEQMNKRSTAGSTLQALAAIRRRVWPVLIAAILAPTSLLAEQDSLLNRQFLDRADAGDLDAVRAMATGRTDELRAVLASAMARKSQSESDPQRSLRMRKSLAALNDAQAREDIRQDLGSPHLYVQHFAFLDAADLGGNDMIRAIAAKLWDPSPGGRPTGPDGVLAMDVGIAALRHMAVVALSQLVIEQSAPRIDLQRIRYRDEDVERWKIWWAANRSRYEESQ